MDKNEIKRTVEGLCSQLTELHILEKRLTNALEHIRASCMHEPKPVNGSIIVVCAICGTLLEGCLSTLTGQCVYDEGSEVCLYCGQPKQLETASV